MALDAGRVVVDGVGASVTSADVAMAVDSSLGACDVSTSLAVTSFAGVTGAVCHPRAGDASRNAAKRHAVKRRTGATPRF